MAARPPDVPGRRARLQLHDRQLPGDAGGAGHRSRRRGARDPGGARARRAARRQDRPHPRPLRSRDGDRRRRGRARAPTCCSTATIAGCTTTPSCRPSCSAWRAPAVAPPHRRRRRSSCAATRRSPSAATRSRAIHTPGHTPGSICLYFEESGRDPAPVRGRHAVQGVDRPHRSVGRLAARHHALDPRPADDAPGRRRS